MTYGAGAQGTSTDDTSPQTSASESPLDAMMIMFSPECAANPLPTYDTLRSECPVAKSPFGMGGEHDSWMLSRYDDVKWALQHPEVFSSEPGGVNLGQEHMLIPLQVDPPDHAKYRRVLDPEFSPRRMAALEPDVRQLVAEVIDQFIDKGAIDFHEEFATPLPSTMFLRLMGLPQDDLAQFLLWRDNTIRPDVEPGDFEGAQRIREATGVMITDYFKAAIEWKRASPDEELLSRLVHGEIEGRPFTDAELLGMCHLLLLAGLDTVTATLDCMVAYLARNPEQRRALVERPELIDVAIEEMLRTETPVAIVARTVKQDVELRGQQLRVGDGVTVGIGPANGDGDEFTDAHAVDFERHGNRHLAFGAGPHRCLGSHFARLELRVALEEFHKRIPDYAIAEGAEITYSPAIRQTMGLPIVW